MNCVERVLVRKHVQEGGAWVPTLGEKDSALHNVAQGKGMITGRGFNRAVQTVESRASTLESTAKALRERHQSSQVPEPSVNIEARDRKLKGIEAKLTQVRSSMGKKGQQTTLIPSGQEVSLVRTAANDLEDAKTQLEEVQSQLSRLVRR